MALLLIISDFFSQQDDERRSALPLGRLVPPLPPLIDVFRA